LRSALARTASTTTGRVAGSSCASAARDAGAIAFAPSDRGAAAQTGASVADGAAAVASAAAASVASAAGTSFMARGYDRGAARA
jgi:hypothetical protein